MNGNSVVADTNILLYIFEGDAVLSKMLRGRQFYISFITEMELLSLTSLSITESKKIDQFLSQSTIIDINPAIKKTAINLRKHHKLKLPDAIIAATAFYLNIPLITADQGFKKLPEQDIIFYSK